MSRELLDISHVTKGALFNLYYRQTRTEIGIPHFSHYEVTNRENPLEDNEDESHKDPQVQ